MCVLHRFLRVFAICFGGLHCAPECTAYFYRPVLHLVFAGTYCSPWHGTDRKWEGGWAPPFFFELIVFSWSVLLGLCSGISETHVHCQFLGAWCRYHLGDQFLFFVCFLMTWSGLLFGKSSVQCIDHGYVLDVNFIPYCMYSSHFLSRVFTFL